jgi:hypothetical protein
MKRKDANLAAATATDRQFTTDMMATNKMLLEQLALKDRELAQLRAQRPAAIPAASADSASKKRYPNENYCWSHGYDVSKDHTSVSCKFPKDGHQTTATRTNNQNGSQLYKDRIPR